MFNLIQRSASKAIAACAIAATFIAAPASATTLSFVPSSNQVAVGGNVAVDIRISDIGAGDDLGVFDFNVLFNASVLNLTGYALGTGLGDVNSGDGFDFGAGSIGSGKFNLAELSFLSDLSSQASSFSLGTLYFTSVGAGSSLFSFSDVVLGDAFGNALTADLGNATISAVPEPQTVFLFLSGLGLVALLRRKQQ